MRTLATTLLVSSVTLASVADGAGKPGYYRQPAIHGDTVVFVAEGDLWSVPVSGGVAQRITTHHGQETRPSISPDGSLIAFTAGYEGPAEIYTMPLGGGLPTRRTFEGAGSDRYLRPVGWAPDGRLVYTTRRLSTVPNSQLVLLDLASGDEERVPLEQAADGVYGSSSLVFTRLPFNGSWGKRYDGGTVEQLWRFDGSGDEAVALTSDFRGASREPMWWDGRVVFATDRDGTMNLWSMTLDGGDLRQHTQHYGFDVLGPSNDGDRVVYQHRADLRIHNLSTGEDSLIPITLNSDFDQTREKWVEKPMDYVTSWDISPDGDRVVLTARGEVFAVPTDHGRIVRATRASGVRYRRGAFMPDGERLMVMSDESGEVEFWSLPADGIGEPEQHSDDASILIMQYEVSPDGTKAAYANKNFGVWIRDLETGEKTFVDEGGFWYSDDLEWSLDSRWLTYTLAVDGSSHGEVHLFDTQTGAIEALTTRAYNSYDARFSADGKWIYLISERHFRTIVGSPWGPRQPEPHFDRPAKIFQIALEPNLASPFLEPNELMGQEQDETKSEESDTDESAENDGEDADGEAVEPVSIDLDGIATRLYEVPAGNGNYFNLMVGEDTLFWMDVEDLHAGDQILKSMKITGEKPEVKTVASGVRGVVMSADRKKLLLRKGADLHVIDAAHGEVKLNDESKVDLGDWEFSLIPLEERRQMFVDSWRLMRDYFYDPGLHGVDWQEVLDRHLPLVDRVTDRAELSDLVAQMVSELSALHTFVYGGDQRDGDENVQPASLGARLVRDARGGGFRIEHIYLWDPDEPERQPPLGRPDLRVSVGDVITMIDGVDLSAEVYIQKHLRAKVGEQVRLRIKDAEDGSERDVIVHPISQGAEADLRYHEWEYTRRLRVEEASDGRIGYIHLRAMGAGNMAEWIRHYPRAFDKEGLIIDVRYNRGGNIDSWILNRLLRKAWFFWQGRAGKPYWNMQMAFRGHKATLINERTASDGEAFAEGFRRLGMGPLIGTRTWGGGIWLTSSNLLVDGGIATAAEFGVYGPEGEWIIEGSGVSPDIEIDNPPHATFMGADAQLDHAVEFLLQKMEEEPVEVTPKPEGKDLSFPERRMWGQQP